MGNGRRGILVNINLTSPWLIPEELRSNDISIKTFHIYLLHHTFPDTPFSCWDQSITWKRGRWNGCWCPGSLRRMLIDRHHIVCVLWVVAFRENGSQRPVPSHDRGIIERAYIYIYIYIYIYNHQSCISATVRKSIWLVRQFDDISYITKYVQVTWLSITIIGSNYCLNSHLYRNMPHSSQNLLA